MRYLQRKRIRQAGKAFGDPAFRDDDPMTGVANLFDIGLVFIVGLLMTLMGVFRMQDLFDQQSKLTIVKQRESGEMEILVKDGAKLTATKVTREAAKGMGSRLGVAYRLKDGSMVYVPDEKQ
ncbi:DUF2149 domain-containing protein [Desulforhopalus singaporensis]|uniref:DUF2149 domain-containing protein n=1 Tax=Desulforhopalus singaporensis TaxID=91360 RepID=A0A1H0SHV3_9BACT|nr:DUF2149 domain-containing protein [Desulforhopalus singaporensis]SDP41361.1 hypothetical protein SAMN05660330_02683 [Desulforhopalus singaporensis]